MSPLHKLASLKRLRLLSHLPLTAQSRVAVPASRYLHVHAEPPSYGPVPKFLPADFTTCRVLSNERVAVDSSVVRVSLPEGVASLEQLGAPSGVKVRHEIESKMYDKSYSPISAVDEVGTFDLLVRAYDEPSLGAHICALQAGDEIEVKFKGPKLFHGEPYRANRFKELALIGNGTGVAPLFQLAKTVLGNSEDLTRVTMVAAHHDEAHSLMVSELSSWAANAPAEIRSFCTLAQPQDTTAWLSKGGWVGRLTASQLLKVLPSPADSGVHIVVCGSDSFLNDVCGPILRAPVPGKAKLKKLQGPTEGLLGAIGFEPSQVTKL